MKIPRLTLGFVAVLVSINVAYCYWTMAHTYAIPSIDDVQDKTVMKYCDEGLKEIESVIIEAEKNFSIKEYLAWV